MAVQRAKHDSSIVSSMNQNLGTSKPTQHMDTGSQRERKINTERQRQRDRDRDRDTRIEEGDA